MKHLIHVHRTGPLIEYDAAEEVLIIEDLNPQVKLTWRMSRQEMLDMLDNLTKALRQ